MITSFTRRLQALLLSLAAVTSPWAWAANSTPQDDIRSLISKTYDQPGHLVQTAPVVVVGEHAVAGWTQGDRGGRALLRKTKGHWSIVACGGAGLKEVKTLKETRVPGPVAEKLAARLAEAEKPLPAETLRRFDSFGEVLTLPATGTPAHGHAPH